MAANGARVYPICTRMAEDDALEQGLTEARIIRRIFDYAAGSAVPRLQPPQR